MITWRFKRANTRTFGGTQHAFSQVTFPEMSICGLASKLATSDKAPGYSSLPGVRCKTCLRMVKTQQEFQDDPGGGR